MSNFTIAKRFPLVVLRPRIWASLARIANSHKALRRRSRQQLQAEAIVDRFGCDRWSDAIEREISIRVR
jgi:hypothetical protein